MKTDRGRNLSPLRPMPRPTAASIASLAKRAKVQEEFLKDDVMADHGAQGVVDNGMIPVLHHIAFELGDRQTRFVQGSRVAQSGVTWRPCLISVKVVSPPPI